MHLLNWKKVGLWTRDRTWWMRKRSAFRNYILYYTIPSSWPAKLFSFTTLSFSDLSVCSSCSFPPGERSIGSLDLEWNRIIWNGLSTQALLFKETSPIVSTKVSHPSLSRCLLPKERIGLSAAQNQPNLFMVTSPYPTLFVLLHVPYGIQIQSSLLPMIEVKIRNVCFPYSNK